MHFYRARDTKYVNILKPQKLSPQNISTSRDNAIKLIYNRILVTNLEYW